MTGAELTALALVAAWLVVLTLMLLVVVRHTGLLTLAIGSTDSRPGDGLLVGSLLPAEVVEQRPELDRELRYLVFLSGNCASCAEVAPHLAELPEPDRVIVFVAGSNARANRKLIDKLPSSLDVVAEAQADAMVTALQIHSTPYALQTENGILTGKAAIRSTEQLQGFIRAYEASDAHEIAISAREAATNAR
jgi:hypothetical protein